MQAWHDGGIASYFFNPSTTFPGAGNKYIQNYAPDFMQTEGKFFYLSHPPFAYYFPYVIFSILNIYPNVAALQVFNILFHFITSVFLYLIVCQLLQEDARKQFSWAGFFSSLFYFFMPATLWFHSNVYMSDMFVQNMWIISLYFLFIIIFQKNKQNKIWLFLFALSIFITIYTDWVGVFFSAAAILFFMQNIFRRNPSYKPLLVSTIIATLMSLGLIAVQYSAINGWRSLLKYFTSDYTIRGSTYSPDSIFLSLRTLAFNYGVSYLPLIIFILAAGVWNLVRKKRNSVLSLHHYSSFAWFTLFPVLSDHAIFLNYSGHDFSVLKASFFLCATGGILLYKLMTELKSLPTLKSLLFAFTICAGGIIMYFLINPPGKLSLEHDPYDAEIKTGYFIADHSTKDEVVFADNMEVTPQVIFYAHRNIMKIKNDSDAVRFLTINNEENGIVISNKNDSLQFQVIKAQKN